MRGLWAMLSSLALPKPGTRSHGKVQEKAEGSFPGESDMLYLGSGLSQDVAVGNRAPGEHSLESGFLSVARAQMVLM